MNKFGKTLAAAVMSCAAAVMVFATPSVAGDAAATPPAGAAPAADIKDRTSPPDPVSELAKSQGFKFEDGRYRNKDGDPQYVVTKDYMVDWGTWNGFRRYHDACHVCHGPNALGSTFAPALKDSLKTMDYNTFVATVSGGRKVNRARHDGTSCRRSARTRTSCATSTTSIPTSRLARPMRCLRAGPNGREDISRRSAKKLPTIARRVKDGISPVLTKY